MATRSAAGSPVRRRRTSLDRERIVEAALTLSKDGEPLTVRALGVALGADPTSIYRHFREKDEVLSAAVDALFARALTAVDRSADWRAQLVAYAEASLHECLTHPAIGRHARTLTTHGGGELAVVDHILGQFTRAGLDHADAVRFYGVLDNHILATCSALAAMVDAGNSPDDPWIGDVGTIDQERYPALVWAREPLRTLGEADVYRQGVEVVLDAAAARAAAG